MTEPQIIGGERLHYRVVYVTETGQFAATGYSSHPPGLRDVLFVARLEQSLSERLGMQCCILTWQEVNAPPIIEAPPPGMRIVPPLNER